MSFDPIDMAIAKSHCNSKGGYTVPAKKYTFDGNIEGKPIMDFDYFVMVQISSDVVDVTSVQTITVNNFTVSVNELKIANTDEYGVIGLDREPYVILFKTGGVFVRYEEGVDVVREVSCKETIVPIKAEYLPESSGGGGLPVVELETELVIDELGNAIDLSDNDSLALDNVKDAQSPVIVRFTLENTQVSAVMSKVNAMATICVLGGMVCLDSFLFISISNFNGDGWQFGVTFLE